MLVQGLCKDKIKAKIKIKIKNTPIKDIQKTYKRHISLTVKIKIIITIITPHSQLIYIPYSSYSSQYLLIHLNSSYPIW